MSTTSPQAPIEQADSRLREDRWRWVKWGVRALLALAIFALLVAYGRIDVSRLLAIRPSWQLAGLFGCVLLSMAIPAYRWWYLLRMQDVREPFVRVLHMTWLGYLAAIVLPGAVGGDLARAWLVARGRKANRFRPVATVVIDRAAGMYSLLCLSLVPLAVLTASGDMTRVVALTLAVPLALLAGMTLAIAALAWGPTQQLALWCVPQRFRQVVADSLAIYYESPTRLAWLLLVSLVSNVFMVGSFYYSCGVLGLNATWTDAFLAGPLVILANVLPLTPGGIGTAEAVSDQVFAALGTSSGADVMLLVRSAIVLCSLPACLFTGIAPAAADESGHSVSGSARSLRQADTL